MSNYSSENKISRNTLTGIFCGIMAGVLWALSGAFGQYLYQIHPEVESNWLVSVRMLFSGLILILYSMVANRKELTALVSTKKDFLVAILTGIGGTMMFQLSFFKAIQYSNAGTATILQYLCPALTMIFVCVRSHRLPKLFEVVASLSALIGIFLLSTHGNPSELVINNKALGWGVASAVFMLICAVVPEKLYTRYNSLTVLTIAMTAGGIVLSGIFRPWEYQVVLNISLFVSMFFIIVSGSIFGYFFYGTSVHLIGPDKTTLFACSEPLASALFSAIWLKSVFTGMDLLSFALILATIFIQTFGTKKGL